jgi:hypothetical protein
MPNAAVRGIYTVLKAVWALEYFPTEKGKIGVYSSPDDRVDFPPGHAVCENPEDSSEIVKVMSDGGQRQVSG